MAKKKVQEPTDAEVDAATAALPQAEAQVSDKPAKASKTAVVVKFRDHKGEPTERTFSQDVHGDDFAKLADEFKETNKSRLIIE
jgi:hypothetical protein